MTLNGKPLTLGANDELPELAGEKATGKFTLAAGSCALPIKYVYIVGNGALRRSVFMRHVVNTAPYEFYRGLVVTM